MESSIVLIFIGILFIVGSYSKTMVMIAKKIGKAFIVLSGNAFTFSGIKSENDKDKITRGVMIYAGIFFFVAAILSFLF